MGIFNRKQAEERVEKDWRPRPWSEEENKSNDGDLMCEEAIIKDKKRYGRVRNSLMKYLRSEYGNDTANRALWRVTSRMSKGYLQ
ncbi:MAG: hypothetical protein ACREA3_09960 [Nitrosotalea sp.]